MDSEMLGSLMMVAAGVLASGPSSARASGTRWSSVSTSGKTARMRAAREMSRVSTSTPAARAKVSIIGSSECVASAGASSVRSEEHTSELQSLMRISYAVFCLKKKKKKKDNTDPTHINDIREH